MQRGPSRRESRDGPPPKGPPGSREPVPDGRRATALRQYKTIYMTRDGADICELNNRLADLAPRLPEGLEGPLCRQRLELVRLDLSELEQSWEALEEARERDVQNTESTTVGIPAEDPDFARVRQMEAELEWYMTQAIRLQHLCEAYRSEAETWRKKTEELANEKGNLAAKTFIVRRENELIEAAAGELEPSSDLGAVIFLRRGPRQPTPRGASRAGAAGRQRLAAAAPERTLAPGRPAAPGASGGAPSTAGAREREYLEEIARLEARVQRARQAVRRQRELHRGLAQLNGGHKDDMEHFFLLCMHDLQQEVQRRRSADLARRSSPRDRAGGERRTGRRALQREQVLDMLVSSDHLLNLLYERLFPHRLGASRASARDVSASMVLASASCSSSAAAAESALASGGLTEGRLTAALAG